MSTTQGISCYLLREALVFQAFTERPQGSWGSNEYVTRLELPIDEILVGQAMLDSLSHSGDPFPEEPNDPRGFWRLYDVAQVKDPAELHRKAQCIHVDLSGGLVSLTPMVRVPRRNAYTRSPLPRVEGVSATDPVVLGRELMKLFSEMTSLD